MLTKTTESYNTSYGCLRKEQAQGPRGGLYSTRVEEWDADTVARFWRRYVVSPSGCWEWKGARTPKGYGQCFVGRQQDGRQINNSAHRIAYILTHGSIPERLHIRHTCDNPGCMN